MIKLAKAIEILTDQALNPKLNSLPDLRDSIHLSIEAMKRIQDCRLHPSTPVYKPLPGEDDWREPIPVETTPL